MKKGELGCANIQNTKNRYKKFTFNFQALEVMKMKDPPTKSDEENCNVRYRIEPSGKRIFMNLRFGGFLKCANRVFLVL